MDATEYVRRLAERVTATAESLGPVAAALLAGSGARGDADFYSDLDLLLYVERLLPPERLGELCERLDGTDPVSIAPRDDDSDALQFLVGGVAVQVCSQTVAAAERGSSLRCSTSAKT